MSCPRCQGLMVPVRLYDHGTSIEDRWWSTTQCVNCSYIDNPDRKEVANAQESSPSAHAHAQQEREEVDHQRECIQVMAFAYPLIGKRRSLTR